MRQIVLDTETTGLEASQGHRIIEIGCVELVNRRLTGNHYHQYLQPDREIDVGAIEVHGITNEMLADKPRFVDVAAEFVAFIGGAELIIHNAPFDVGFINAELERLADDRWLRVNDYATVLDTLVMARQMNPGQRSSLDALCKRYEIDNSRRELHGALLDAEILADVYLAMTGGQTALQLDDDSGGAESDLVSVVKRLDSDRLPLSVLRATAEEQLAHDRYLALLERESGAAPIWKQLGG
ncbi:MAG: DNA polymerase III subunit epsilon [Gammaproteobacteria bacterium]|nr:DNA polymerase III subunit epsilon [Gammaproteobacteria bacterium]